MGVEPQYNDAGQLTGFSKLPLTQAQQDAEEILNLQLSREKQALAGELPVNPAWTKQKSDTMSTFQESMRRQGLKPGDTGYDKALAELSTQLEGTEYGLRSGDISLYEGLSMARGVEQDRKLQQALANYNMVPGTGYGGGLSFGQAAQAYNAPLSYYQGNRAGELQATIAKNTIPSALYRGLDLTNKIALSATQGFKNVMSGLGGMMSMGG